VLSVASRVDGVAVERSVLVDQSPRITRVKRCGILDMGGILIILGVCGWNPGHLPKVIRVWMVGHFHLFCTLCIEPKESKKEPQKHITPHIP
jgi:hypothetical protein